MNPNWDSDKKSKKVKNLTENSKVAMVCDEYSEFGAYLRGILIQGEARVISKKTEFQKYRKLLCQKFTQHEKSAPIAERDTLIVEVIPQNVESWGCKQ